MNLKELEKEIESKLFKIAEQKKNLADQESNLLIELYKVRGKLEAIDEKPNIASPLATDAHIRNTSLDPVINPKVEIKPESSPTTFTSGVGNKVKGASFVV